jgi:hypothetical protein
MRERQAGREGGREREEREGEGEGEKERGRERERERESEWFLKEYSSAGSVVYIYSREPICSLARIRFLQLQVDLEDLHW